MTQEYHGPDRENQQAGPQPDVQVDVQDGGGANNIGVVDQDFDVRNVIDVAPQPGMGPATKLEVAFFNLPGKFRGDAQPPAVAEEQSLEKRKVPENIDNELRAGLIQLLDNLQDFTREEIMSVAVNLLDRLDVLKIKPQDLAPDVQDLFTRIFEAIHENDKHQKEMLLTLEDALADAPELGDIDLEALTANQPLLIEAGTAQVDSREPAVDPAEDVLNVTQPDAEGKEVKAKLTLKQLFVALTAAGIGDLFGGNNIDVLMDEAGDMASKYLLVKLGIPIEMQKKFSKDAVNYWLENSDTTKLHDKLANAFSPSELANFLGSINDKDAAALLVGKPFGSGTSGIDRHRFSEQQTESVVSRLSSDQLHHLLKRFDGDALTTYFENLSAEDRAKCLAGQKFGPRQTFQFSSGQLGEIKARLPASLRNQPST